MCHSKALFLIYDKQPQIFELYIFRKQPVRTDDNIHLAFSQIFDGTFLFRRTPETAQQIHANRKVFHAL